MVIIYLGEGRLGGRIRKLNPVLNMCELIGFSVGEPDGSQLAPGVGFFEDREPRSGGKMHAL